MVHVTWTVWLNSNVHGRWHASEVISIVVPVRDGMPWLDDQLSALTVQTCGEDWEVVVADNGSSDGSLDLVRSWTSRFPRIRLVDASERSGPAAARNVGAREASGDLLAFCDADDVVRAGWLSSLVAALANADVVSGFFDMRALNDGVASDPIPPATHQLGFLPAGLTSNLAMRRAAFEEAGGFSEDLHVGEDVDLCWRLQLAGRRFEFAPEAVVEKREHEKLPRVFSRAVEYGRCGPLLYRMYRGSGARPQFTTFVKSFFWLLISVLRLGNPSVRRLWVRTAGLRLGRAIGSIEQRVFFP